MWSRSPVLILDRGSWNVVAMPFKKFFNYGEKDADRIDWGSAKVYEKLDGSLLTLYFHSGEWHVALSKPPIVYRSDGKLQVQSDRTKRHVC